MTLLSVFIRNPTSAYLLNRDNSQPRDRLVETSGGPAYLRVPTAQIVSSHGGFAGWRRRRRLRDDRRRHEDKQYLRRLPGLPPGHTPGSAFYTLRDGGEELVFVGDIVHSAAVQFPDTAVTIAYDLDAAGAARVRAEAFDEFARNETLIAAPHTAFPGIGHVRRNPVGYDWVPVNYTNRGPN